MSQRKTDKENGRGAAQSTIRDLKSATVLALTLMCSASLAFASPYADSVVSYTPGTGASAFYADPQTALGEPSRFTPDPDYPSVVSLVSAPYLGSQIVQLGVDGSLTVQFDEPITNDSSHAYGIDLLVFGNSFFNYDFDKGALTSPAALFSDGTGKIEVSADGSSFFEVTGVFADRLFPTQGYLDSRPFDPTPGLVPTDFQKPVNPALTLSDFSGLTFEQAVALYDGSGGGTGVDIGVTGLSNVSYVRITNTGGTPLEIDAFSTVPEPTSIMLIAAAIALGLRRKHR